MKKKAIMTMLAVISVCCVILGGCRTIGPETVETA